MKMKKIFALVLTLVMMCSTLGCFAAENDAVLISEIDAAVGEITLQIGNPMMTVSGKQQEIYPGENAVPVIIDNRTLVPIRAIIEAMGGNVAWDNDKQEATLTYNDDVIKLTIGSTKAYLNDTEGLLDVAPVIIDNRTMLPIRYIAEGFNFRVKWIEETQTVTINPPVGTNEFDFEKRTVLLNDGREMPILGIGTFTLTQEQAENSVYHALKYGYRLIDTAAAYNNEEGVGKGIAKSEIPREEIFVTTKLWPSNYNMEGIDACLERLGLEYVDLMLLHQPMGDYIGGYKAMEEAVKQGKIKSIGVSNFTKAQFEEIMEIAEIPPAINQVETHLWNQQLPMIDFLDKYGTVIEAWFPLGGRGNTQKLFAEPVIVELGEKYNKSSAQIILRWHLQTGHIAIPGSSNPDHILENISIFDFELTDDEIARINALNKAEPFFKGFGTSQAEQDAADRWGLDIAPESKPEEKTEEKKSLVVYFSVPETDNAENMTKDEDNSVVVIDGKVLGNTQYIAQLIAENTGADIFEIEPKEPYTTDHDALVDLADKEKKENARPALKYEVVNLDDYDTVFVGYPTWWADMPMILYTFLESHDLADKTVIPFNTHGGSGFAGTIDSIKKIQVNANVLDNGFSVSRDDAENAKEDVIKWLKELGYVKE